MRYFVFLLCLLAGCTQETQQQAEPVQRPNRAAALHRYIQNNPDTGLSSRSTGKVSDGQLINGKRFPFSGPNFRYFDTASYLGGRAYLHEHARQTALDAYARMEKLYPGRLFFIMECSRRQGGRMFPHRTHRNGLSIDFMMPKCKNREPYYGLDTLGSRHYFLAFNDNGTYSKDTSIRIDFECLAQHLLLLQEEAKKHRLSIERVIVKIEMKKFLFAGPCGQRLKKSGIYLVRSLDRLANRSHDEHYHVDFRPF